MKIITVPLSKESMDRLDYNESKDGDLLELELNDNDIVLLNKSNIIEMINFKLNINIDDYEDESIQDIKKINELNELLMSVLCKENERLIYSILKLTNTALNRKTGIFFYF